jgi:hypothetical protein
LKSSRESTSGTSGRRGRVYLMNPPDYNAVDLVEDARHVAEAFAQESGNPDYLGGVVVAV